MKNEEVSSALLKIFNRNIPIEDRYTADEIKIAFSKKDYSLGSEREKQLYIRFFKEFDNDQLVNQLQKNYKISSQKINSLYKTYSEGRKREFGNYWSQKVNRRKLSLSAIDVRGKGIYHEIDNFELYELTPCIAYEMAFRNDKVISLLSRYEKVSTMLGDNNHHHMCNVCMSKSLYGFMYGIEDEKKLENEYPKYKALYEKKQLNYRKLIEKDYKIFIDDYIDMCTELHISTLSELQKKIEDELINNYLIYPKGYRRNVPSATSFLYEEEITNSHKKEGRRVIDNNTDEDTLDIRFEEIINDGFIQVQGVHINSEEYFVNNIIPNFSRQVNDQNQIKIPINFSLPLKEILEYIKIVKNKINSKTPLELLGEKLKIAGDLTTINTNKQKYTDLLYIYDMKKKGFTDKLIGSGLLDYYSDKETDISDTTIKKYLDIAEDYIDKEHYKELITGKVKKSAS